MKSQTTAAEAASTTTVELPKQAVAKQSPIAGTSFKELNQKKAKTFETQLKAIEGVKEAAITTKAKRIIVTLTLNKKEDAEVFQQVSELAASANLKVGRSYFMEDALTVNLTQN